LSIVCMFFVRKKEKILLLIVASLIYLSSITPVQELLIIPLEDAYPVPAVNQIYSSDAYVVLGGGINDNAPDIDIKGTLGNEALPRYITAYRLYMRNPKPIIISGGKILNRGAEAGVAKNFLLSLGVKSEHIIVEDKSRDTAENRHYIKELCDRHGIKSIVLITSAFHMKRSMMLFKKSFTSIIPFPAGYKTSRIPYDFLSYLPDGSNLMDTSLALKEYLGILFYAIKP